MSKVRKSKNQLRREKLKLRKLENQPNNSTEEQNENVVNELSEKLTDTETQENGIEIEDSDPLLKGYESVFVKFKVKDSADVDNSSEKEVLSNSDDDESASDYSDNSDNEDATKTLSKRQLRKRNKIPLSQLRSSTFYPQVVEWSDADAKDPFLLVALKSRSNAIQVPAHWKSKREYLSSRKGIERSPFQLPKFIQSTGIQDMRNNEDQTLKQDQRARVQPKMGKLDIDYQKLHDAFFKYQSKPRLFGFGEVYFEGKEGTDEYVEEIASIVPGSVSSKLRSALGLSANDLNVPPPWITIMQEIGKPPAYESLIVPGLDIEYSNEGYKNAESKKENDVNHIIWGKLQVNEESSEESEVENSEDDAEVNEEDEDKIHYDDDDNDTPSSKKINEIEISEYGNNVMSNNISSNSNHSNSQKELYTVVKEDITQRRNGLLQGEYGYSLADKTKKDEAESNKKLESENTPKKFRF